MPHQIEQRYGNARHFRLVAFVFKKIRRVVAQNYGWYYTVYRLLGACNDVAGIQNFKTPSARRGTFLACGAVIRVEALVQKYNREYVQVGSVYADAELLKGIVVPFYIFRREL